MPAKRTEIRPDPPVGSYVPPKHVISEEAFQAFREAHEQLQAELRAAGIDGDQLVDEYFEELRKKKQGRKIA
jgi:hypothetical protein